MCGGLKVTSLFFGSLVQAARMNQAKRAAAHSWRSTLSSGGEEKEGQKVPSVSEDESGKEEHGKPQEQRDGEKGDQDMQSVQLQALDARYCERGVGRGIVEGVVVGGLQGVPPSWSSINSLHSQRKGCIGIRESSVGGGVSTEEERSSR